MNLDRRWISATWAAAIAAAAALAACSSDGVTPVCSEGGECETPPGDAVSEIINTGGSGGTAGTDGGD